MTSLPSFTVLRAAPRGLALVVAIAAAAGCGPDATTPDDGGAHDAGVLDGTGDGGDPDLGMSCDDPTDCPSGFCVDTPVGGVCTHECDGACPAGWECRVTDVGGELV